MVTNVGYSTINGQASNRQDAAERFGSHAACEQQLQDLPRNPGRSGIMNKMETPTIAGVVLCLNEAKNLPRALGSLTWCDEVLVVDSGSKDGSQEIAISLWGSRCFNISKLASF